MAITYADLEELLGSADDVLSAAENAFEYHKPKTTEQKLRSLQKRLRTIDDELDEKPDSRRAQTLRSQLEAIRDRIGELHYRARNRRDNTTRDGVASPWKTVASLLASILQFILTLLGLPLFATAIEGVKQILARE